MVMESPQLVKRHRIMHAHTHYSVLVTALAIIAYCGFSRYCNQET